ncbi:LRR receptor-like serine/threonine-protein kinase [Pyrus ussuriensis x Pyrus communis]|uniref:non-specific serine/threonine protein kinase n=1 Tax=Pyrus ussuriensis x Pyrus communis TaxID=2448454 RepID=A0A5N5I884_9ROSA|nr:LRR receptor-like serine/threonine-protein kinase [Pyrus ussuriensis x Pyrus communis]
MILQEEIKFTFGEVVKAVDDFHDKVCKAELKSGQVVAVKRLNTEDSNDIPAINLRSFKNEIRTLINIRYHNIIRLYGFCSRRGCIFLLYEYFEKGSMGKSLYGVEGVTELGWATRVKILKGLAHKLSYLHSDCSLSIVHQSSRLSHDNVGLLLKDVLDLDQQLEPPTDGLAKAVVLVMNWLVHVHILDLDLRCLLWHRNYQLKPCLAFLNHLVF